MTFVMGAVGMLAVLLLLLVGAVAGWVLRGTYIRLTRPVAPTPQEQERKRLIEEQQAFQQLQNYSVERAYGLVQDDLLEREYGRG